jgi:5-methylcytosine-specific restriction endonuclease McrA
MSNFVFVLDASQRPLNPCTAGMARSLLKAGKAAVFRMFPFTILLKKVVEIESEPFDTAQGAPLELKIDPGSKVTGFALLSSAQLIWAAELTHRGLAIKASLDSRRSHRRGRRNRHTRYRQPRFLNRTRPEGWLAPSLMHRVLTIETWVKRLIKLAPIGAVVQELVRFDLRQIENPEISGVEYRQGELAGYEVREYLLNKWDRRCAYCSVENVPLQIEHIQPKAKGGTNRVSNLCLSCEKCNLKKGTQNINDFLSKKPDLLKRFVSQFKRPLKDAAAVNSTRWKLFETLKATGLPVKTASGGQTKFNRKSQGLPKMHWLDAACVGDTPKLEILTDQPLLIKAMGQGGRQKCRTDKYGFPSRYVPKDPFVKGFQTGDIVKAVVTKGKKIGAYMGRIAVRSSGRFNVLTVTGLIQGINYKCCSILHKKDGYSYAIPKSTS